MSCRIPGDRFFAAGGLAAGFLATAARGLRFGFGSGATDGISTAIASASSSARPLKEKLNSAFVPRATRIAPDLSALVKVVAACRPSMPVR